MDNRIEALGHLKQTELYSKGDYESWTESEDLSSNSDMEISLVDLQNQNSSTAIKTISIDGSSNQIFNHCRVKILQEANKENRRLIQRLPESINIVGVGDSSPCHLRDVTEFSTTHKFQTPSDPLMHTCSAAESETFTCFTTSIELQVEKVGKEIGDISQNCKIMKPRLRKLEGENNQLKIENEILHRKLLAFQNRLKVEKCEDESVCEATVETSYRNAPSQNAYSTGIRGRKVALYGKLFLFFNALFISTLLSGGMKCWYYYGFSSDTYLKASIAINICLLMTHLVMILIEVSFITPRLQSLNDLILNMSETGPYPNTAFTVCKCSIQTENYDEPLKSTIRRRQANGIYTV